MDVGSASGIGGPSTEFALAAAIEIDGQKGLNIAAFSSDGVDGPPEDKDGMPIAGAIVDGGTCSRARAMGLDPADFLARHDSRTFFTTVAGAIRTGPTGTNVNHVFIGLREG